MEHQAPNRYTLGDIIIDGERFDEPYNVAAIMIELNLFENLDIPYITGSILLSDSAALSTIINFNGQETITINVAVNDEEPLKKTFIIHAVGNTIKSGSNQSSIILLHFIEAHGYHSNFLRLNDSHDGKFDKIIFNVLTGSLNLKLKADQFEECHQSARVIAPNLTPLGFTDMLRRRATSAYGEPFYLYSTLRTGINFRSLGSLYSDQSSLGSYRYTRVMTEVADVFEDTAHRILDLSMGSSDDTIELAKRNTFSGDYVSLNTFRRRPLDKNRSTFDLKEDFQRRKDAGRLADNRNFNQFDTKFTVGPEEKSLNDANRIIISHINTSDMYGADSNAFDEEPINEDHIKRVARESNLNMLDKQAMNITIPGHSMLHTSKNTSVGTLIDITIPRDAPLTRHEDERLVIDSKRSGTYLVTACRHKFDGEGQYYAALQVKRTDTRDNLEDDSDRNVR